MVMLVSMAQASDHLKRDTDTDDNDMRLKIQAASAAVIGYLKDETDFLDSFGETDGDSEGDPEGVPELVQQATLLMLGHFYRWRAAGDTPAFTDGPPDDVKCLLNLYGRKPTLA